MRLDHASAHRFGSVWRQRRTELEDCRFDALRCLGRGGLRTPRVLLSPGGFCGLIAILPCKRSGCENLTLAISSAHGVPCRYGPAPDLSTGPLGTDATRSARVYWNA